VCRTGNEDFKATDSRDADWLIVRCAEGFDGGLPLINYELEVYSEENDYHVNTIYLNRTDKSASPGPIFEISGLEPGRNYRLHLYAVNAKGRSDPVVLEPITLKGVAMYTTGEFRMGCCECSGECSGADKRAVERTLAARGRVNLYREILWRPEEVTPSRT
jgi:hypothetical protein